MVIHGEKVANHCKSLPEDKPLVAPHGREPQPVYGTETETHERRTIYLQWFRGFHRCEWLDFSAVNRTEGRYHRIRNGFQRTVLT